MFPVFASYRAQAQTPPMSAINSIPLATDSRHGYAMFLIAAGSVAISFGGLIQRSLETSDPWQIIFYRSLGMLIAATLIVSIRYRGRFVQTVLGIGKMGLLGGVLVSIAGMAFIQSLVHTTIANALFVLGMIPFFAAFFARLFLGEKLRRTTLITMIAAAIGLAIMVIKGVNAGSGFGNLMALITAISFALYAIIVRYKRQTEMMPVMLLSSVIIILISLTVKYGDMSISIRDILLCLFWGGCLSGFVNYMFIIASRHLSAAEVTLIMLLEFALGPIWVWLFIGEIPSMWTILGGGIIILAVALRAIFELIYKPKKEQTPKILV